LQEIDDIAVRDAIDIFQIYIESTVENLFDGFLGIIQACVDRSAA
jgi:hypothetical protein